MAANQSKIINEAPDELIKVIQSASSHDDPSALVEGIDASVEGLKQLSIQASDVETLLDSWKESNDAKTSTLIQRITNVEDQLVTLNRGIGSLHDMLSEQKKRQSIEWAMEQLSKHFAGDFDPFLGKNIDTSKYNLLSTLELFRDILLSFRLGKPFSLDVFSWQKSTEAGKKELRDFVSEKFI